MRIGGWGGRWGGGGSIYIECMQNHNMYAYMFLTIFGGVFKFTAEMSERERADLLQLRLCY